MNHLDKYKLFSKEIEDNNTDIKDLKNILDIPHLKKTVEDNRLFISNEQNWKDVKSLAKINKHLKATEKIINTFNEVEKSYNDLKDFFALINDTDEESLNYFSQEYKDFQKELYKLNKTTLFNGEQDLNNCFLEIHPGSGGTEAQDWAEMLMRMYTMWANKNNYKIEIEDFAKGDVAGIKNVILKIEGEYAYGYLKWETGIHRLVRKSPFDSGSRRHTSFASVFVSPEIDDSISIEINPAELLIETYRSGGAGGQHVNKTDSAVRITHVPTKTVAQCQSERSQHQNKAHAMVQLKSKLYQLALKKKTELKNKLESTKDEISWGNQIRSYVLDSSRIKDLRTNYEVSDCQSVLDGDIEEFLLASLKTLKED